MSGTFGSGGDNPYDAMLDDALRGAAPIGTLVLRRLDGADPGVSIDASRWMRSATHADASVLDGAAGPLLDIGCGPGRMVRAAAGRAVAALGIDVSEQAVAMTSIDGTLALRRSVFDRLPLEGMWGTILLMDGNIGIGGDPVALLERCTALLAPHGAVVVEVDPDPEVWERAAYVTVDAGGRQSDPFPWARVGGAVVEGLLQRSGLVVEREWEANGRRFVRARRRETSSATAAHAPRTAQADPSPSA